MFFKKPDRPRISVGHSEILHWSLRLSFILHLETPSPTGVVHCENVRDNDEVALSLNTRRSNLFLQEGDHEPFCLQDSREYLLGPTYGGLDGEAQPFVPS